MVKILDFTTQVSGGNWTEATKIVQDQGFDMSWLHTVIDEDSGETAMHSAFAALDKTEVQGFIAAVVAKNGDLAASASAVNYSGNTPLSAIVTKKKLLQKFVTLDSKLQDAHLAAKNAKGQNIFHKAANNPDAMTILLSQIKDANQAKALLDVQDIFGLNPLTAAMQKGNAKVVQSILDKAVELDSTGAFLETLLSHKNIVDAELTEMMTAIMSGPEILKIVMDKLDAFPTVRKNVLALKDTSGDTAFNALYAGSYKDYMGDTIAYSSYLSKLSSTQINSIVNDKGETQIQVLFADKNFADMKTIFDSRPVISGKTDVSDLLKPIQDAHSALVKVDTKANAEKSKTELKAITIPAAPADQKETDHFVSLRMEYGKDLLKVESSITGFGIGSFISDRSKTGQEKANEYKKSCPNAEGDLKVTCDRLLNTFKLSGEQITQGAFSIVKFDKVSQATASTIKTIFAQKSGLTSKVCGDGIETTGSYTCSKYQNKGVNDVFSSLERTTNVPGLLPTIQAKALLANGDLIPALLEEASITGTPILTSVEEVCKNPPKGSTLSTDICTGQKVNADFATDLKTVFNSWCAAKTTDGEYCVNKVVKAGLLEAVTTVASVVVPVIAPAVASNSGANEDESDLVGGQELLTENVAPLPWVAPKQLPGANVSNPADQN